MCSRSLFRLERRVRAYLPLIVSLVASFAFIGQTAFAADCDLYPIALSQDSLSGIAPGDVIDDALNGGQPGNFGWLSWSGSPSANYLAMSLENSLSATDYVNPRDGDDAILSAGDWSHGSPGTPNSKKIRDALDALIGDQIVLPVWNTSEGQGNNTEYKIVAFANVILLGYDLTGDDWVSVEFQGYASCGSINQAPLVSAGNDQSVFVTDTITLSGTASDDGQPALASLMFSWTVLQAPPNSSVIFADAQSAATTAMVSEAGEYILQFSASDGELSSSDTIVIQAGLQNSPPTANSGTTQGDEDSEIFFQPTGSDPDDDTLMFAIVQEPTYGSVRFEGFNFIYTPVEDFDGDDAFSYLADDGSLQSEPASVSIDILPVNDAPTSSNGNYATNEDESVSITLDAFDVENDALQYIIVSGPVSGTLTGFSSAHGYTPDPDFNGQDSFTYKVSDGFLDSGISTVTIDVIPQNDAPTVEGDFIDLLEDESATVALQGYDIDGDPLTFEIVSGPSFGIVSGDLPDVVYTPKADAFGYDVFTFKTSDGVLESDVASVNIAVHSVADYPTGIEAGDPASVENHPSTEYAYTSYGVGPDYINKDVAYDSNDDRFMLAWEGGGVSDSGDSLNFTYAETAGDVKASARIDALTIASGQVEGGLMIRSGVGSDAAFASIAFTNDDRLIVRSRDSDGGSLETTIVDWLPLPEYVRLVRVGDKVRSFVSEDGLSWRLIEQRSVTLPHSTLAGLFCASGDNSKFAICEASGLDIRGVNFDAFRDAYLVSDVGPLIAFSDALFREGAESYRFESLGGDGTDGFDHATVAYVPFSGDFELRARVLGLTGGVLASEAGVFARESLDDDSKQVSIYQRRDGFVETIRRVDTGLIPELTGSVAQSPPVFLKLARVGDVISAYYSADGADWTLASEETLALPEVVFVGIYAAGLDTIESIESSFDAVSLATIVPANNSAFVSQELPYALNVSDGIAVALAFENAGTSEWSGDEGYRLKWAGAGESPWGVSEILIPGGVAVLPGAGYEFEFDIAAPSVAGSFESTWSLADGMGGLFGELSDTETIVVADDISLLDLDADGMSDLWEFFYFKNLEKNGSGDFDLDGSTNLEEFQAGTNPADYYNASAPTLLIVKGEGQESFYGNILPIPLTVEVRDSSDNSLLIDAPVAFTVKNGNGAFLSSFEGEAFEELVARSDAEGRARVFYKIENSSAVTSIVEASGGSGSQKRSVFFSEGVISRFPSEDNFVIKLNEGELAGDFMLLINDLDFDVDYSVSWSSADTMVEYYWKSSDEEGGPEFVWNDVRETGKVLTYITNEYTSTEKVELSFEFPYYENRYTEFYISNIGYLSFGRDHDLYGPYGMFPGIDNPGNVIAPFFDSSLSVLYGGEVFFQDFGDYAIIQYDRVEVSREYVTFQVVLYSDGDIEFFYKDMEDEGWNAVIGMQDESKTRGISLSWYETFAKSEMAILISPNHQWLDFDPVESSILSGNSELAVVSVDASRLSGGIFVSEPLLKSNYTGKEEIPLSVTMIVNGLPSVDLIVNSNKSIELVGASLRLDSQASDSESGIETIEILVDGITVASGSSNSLEFDWLASGPGVYELQSTATDFDGGVGESGIVQVTVEEDLDFDQMGDDWETTYFGDLSRDGLGDFDGDGALDLTEFQLGLSPVVSDSDGDGILDGAELTYGFDPFVKDGLEDGDGDRYPNVHEVVNGSDPTDRNSIPVPNHVVRSDGTSAHDSIQSALSSITNPYEIILVGPGVYTGSANVSVSIGWSVLILSEKGPDETRIDGEGLYIGSGTRLGRNCVVNGLTYENCVTTAVEIDGDRAQFVNCMMLENSGGALLIRGDDVRISGCVIARNFSYDAGGGVVVYASNLSIVNSTIVENESVDFNSNEVLGSGIFVGYGDVKLVNSICWNDAASNIYIEGGGVYGENCAIQGEIAGEHFIDIVPEWTFDYRLSFDSPLRGLGKPLGQATVDRDGDLVESNSPLDVGADQFVDADDDELQDSWEKRHFGDVQSNDSEGDADNDGISNEFEQMFGLDPNSSDSGDSDGDGISDLDEVTLSGTNPFLSDTDYDGMLDGYEVANGLNPLRHDSKGDLDLDRYPNIYEAYNGSAANDSTDIPVAGFVVDRAGALGSFTDIQSAIAAVASDYQIIEVQPGTYTALPGEFIGNSTSFDTLIISKEGASNTILDGQGVSKGLRIAVNSVIDGFTIRNCGPIQNDLYSLVSGAGIRIDGAFAIVSNCVLHDNRADYGGAISVFDGNLLLANSTLFGNYSETSGNGIDCFFASVTVENSILWNEGNVEIQGVEFESFVSDSIIKDGWAGSGNQDLDPRLTANGFLTSASPAIDAGNGLGQFDLQGESRPQGAKIDIGADEFVDADADGLADWWELRFFASINSQAGSDDIDSDGVSLELEYLNGIDPLIDGDSDGDGISDVDEILNYGSSPVDLDSDSDGIGDSLEVATGLNPAVADAWDDADGDRYPNIFEAIRGSDPLSSLSVPVPDYIVDPLSGGTHSDIKTAINEANGSGQSFRIVLLKPGVYKGSNNKNLSILNQQTLIISESGAGTTIIDGEGSGSGFTLYSQSAIVGLTIQGMSSGALEHRASTYVSNCLIKNNSREFGAGVFISAGHSDYVHCTIINNRAIIGGSGIGTGRFGQGTFTNCILWNPGLVSEIRGRGAIRCVSSVVRGGGYDNLCIDEDPLVRANGRLRFASPARGAAVPGPYPALDFDGESRPVDGGADIGVDQYSGLGALDADEDDMLDSWEAANGLVLEYFDAYDDPDGDGFANVYEFVQGTNPQDSLSYPTFDYTVDPVTGDDNPSDNVFATISEAIEIVSEPYRIVEILPATYEGGLFVSGVERKGLMLMSREGPKVTQISGGESLWGIEIAVDMFLSGVAIVDCYAAAGSAILVDAANLHVENGLVQRNRVDDSGVVAANRSSLTFTNVTFFRNEIPTENGATVYLEESDAFIRNSILWNPIAASEIYRDEGSILSVSYSIVREGVEFTGVDGNRLNDPLLGGAYGHLGAGSPAIDVGGIDSFAVSDLDGEARPIGASVDIGTDEFSDSDLDGLNDGWELFYFGDLTTSAAGDEDGDGLSNGEEFNAGTDPGNSDTDGDGLSDYDEVTTHGSDPLSADGDRDGLGDAEEVLLGLDPTVDDLDLDLDSDGMTAREELEAGTQPGNPDTDGDGLLDGIEAAFGFDPLVADYVAPDEEAPPAPASLQANSVTSNSVSLSWSSVSDPAAPITYEVWRNDLIVGRTTSASYTDQYGYEDVYDYSYYVLAVDAQGNVSEASEIVEGSTAEGFGPLPGDADGDGMLDGDDPEPNDPANAFRDDDGDAIANRDDAQPDVSAGSPPLIKILNNDDKVNYVVGEDMRLAIQVDSPTATVFVYRNGAPVGEAQRDGNGVFILNWTNLPKGVHRVRADVRNALGATVTTKTFLVDVAEVEAHITFIAASGNRTFGKSYSIVSHLDGERIERPILRNEYVGGELDYDQGFDVHYERFYRGDRRVRIYRDGAQVALFDIGGSLSVDGEYPAVILREIGSSLVAYPLSPSVPAAGEKMLKVANFTQQTLRGGYVSSSWIFWGYTVNGYENDPANGRTFYGINQLESLAPSGFQDFSTVGSGGANFLSFVDLDSPNLITSQKLYSDNPENPDEGNWYKEFTNSFAAFPSLGSLSATHQRDFYFYHRQDNGVIRGDRVSADVHPEIRLTPYNVGSIDYPGGRGHPNNNLNPFTIILPLNDDMDDGAASADNADVALGTEDDDVVRVNVRIDLRGREDAERIRVKLPKDVEGNPVLRGFVRDGASVASIGTDGVEWALSDYPQLLSESGLDFYFEGLRTGLSAAIEVDVLNSDGVPINRVNSSLGSPETLRLDVFGFDLDVDSDNDGVLNRSNVEDDLESGMPGKVLFVNNGDKDDDGVPDFADGMNLFLDDGIRHGGSTGIDESQSFVPVVVELPTLPNIAVRFNYHASDPSLVERSADVEGNYRYEPAPGSLRLWAKDGSELRLVEAVGTEIRSGDFIEPGVSYTREQLGFENDETIKTFYVESVRPSESVGADRIIVELSIEPSVGGELPKLGFTDEVAFTSISVQLLVDNNRDGQILLDGSDATTEDNPYRFWVNDDIDRFHEFGDTDFENSSNDMDTEYDDIGPDESVENGWVADSEDSVINSLRDLEDFTRLLIYIENLQQVFEGNGVRIGLKWSDIEGEPAVKIWENKSLDGGLDYLTDESIGQQHLTLTSPGVVTHTENYAIPAQYWSDVEISAIEPFGHLLFEGHKAGKGRLS